MQKSILILEESPAIQGMIASTLPSGLLSLHQELNPEKFLQQARRVRPDLIFLSNSDRLRDYRVCRSLKSDSQFRDIPLILLLNGRDPLDESALSQFGIVGHLRKPFEAQLFHEQIGQHLSRTLARTLVEANRQSDPLPLDEARIFDSELLELIQQDPPEVLDAPEVDFSSEIAEDAGESSQGRPNSFQTATVTLESFFAQEPGEPDPRLSSLLQQQIRDVMNEKTMNGSSSGFVEDDDVLLSLDEDSLELEDDDLILEPVSESVEAIPVSDEELNEPFSDTEDWEPLELGEEQEATEDDLAAPPSSLGSSDLDDQLAMQHLGASDDYDLEDLSATEETLSTDSLDDSLETDMEATTLTSPRANGSSFSSSRVIDINLENPGAASTLSMGAEEPLGTAPELDEFSDPLGDEGLGVISESGEFDDELEMSSEDFDSGLDDFPEDDFSDAGEFAAPEPAGGLIAPGISPASATSASAAADASGTRDDELVSISADPGNQENAWDNYLIGGDASHDPNSGIPSPEELMEISSMDEIEAGYQDEVSEAEHDIVEALDAQEAAEFVSPILDEEGLQELEALDRDMQELQDEMDPLEEEPGAGFSDGFAEGEDDWSVARDGIRDFVLRSLEGYLDEEDLEEITGTGELPSLGEAIADEEELEEELQIAAEMQTFESWDDAEQAFLEYERYSETPEYRPDAVSAEPEEATSPSSSASSASSPMDEALGITRGQIEKLVEDMIYRAVEKALAKTLPQMVEQIVRSLEKR